MKRQLLSGLLCLALLCGALFLAGCKTKDPAVSDPAGSGLSGSDTRTDGRGNGGERRADGHHPAGRSGQQRKRIQPNRARDDRTTGPTPAAAGSGEGILPGHGERQGLRGERGWRGRRYRVGAGGDRQGLRGRRRVRLYACRDLPPERREPSRENVCLYSDRTWNPDDKNSKGDTVLVPKDSSVSCVVSMTGNGNNTNPVLMNVCIDGQNLGTALAGWPVRGRVR